jgi:hypothetical protein
MMTVTTEATRGEASIRAALADAAGRPLFAVLGVAGSVVISVALSLVGEILSGAHGA